MCNRERFAGNLFADVPTVLPEELVQVLVAAAGVRIERIVSTGHCSPDQFWYDQAEPEWVLVLQGAGVVEFADGTPARTLLPGDHLWIPAHQQHRVRWTSPEEPTIWLAVFVSPTAAQSADAQE